MKDKWDEKIELCHQQMREAFSGESLDWKRLHLAIEMHGIFKEMQSEDRCEDAS